MPKDTQLGGQLVAAPCPVLVNFLVAARRYDAEQKQIKNVLRQRERRKQYKLDAEIAARSAGPLQVVVYPDGTRWTVPVPDEMRPAVALVPAPPTSSGVRRLLAELDAACEPVERAFAAPKTSDELLLNKLDVTPPLNEALERLKKVRSKCRKTAKLLLSRGEIAKPLLKAGQKIMNCSLWGLFQSLNAEVNYKVGTALCKSRLCPNCQRVLSAKRRANFLDWWALNREALRPYFFYHLVLTVHHSAALGLRTGLYTADLLAYFAQLRGTHASLSGYERRSRSAAWKHFVAGGTYSAEIKPALSKDGTVHVHIHCLLVARVQLLNKAQKSLFLSHIEPLWRSITDNENPKNFCGVFLDKVYHKDLDGNRIDSFKGSDVQIEHAVAECAKYTLKADAEDLEDYSDAFLSDLLTMRNRYYSRFGCLSSNDKSSSQFQKMALLRTDYQDLEQVTREELARLLNPETGEVVNFEETCFLATPLRNMRPVPFVYEPSPAREVASVKMQPTGKLWPADGSPLAGTPILAPVAELVPLAGDELPPVRSLLQYYRAEELPSYKALHQYQFFPYEERQRAAVFLSKSIAADYDAALELAPGSNPERS